MVRKNGEKRNDGSKDEKGRRLKSQIKSGKVIRYKQKQGEEEE